MEKAFTGKLRKIITSEWPTEEIATTIPTPNFGKIEKIEYTSKFINVFVQNAKAGNLSSYARALKKMGYKENGKKEDGSVYTERYFKNSENMNVRIRFNKANKRIEIYLSK